MRFFFVCVETTRVKPPFRQANTKQTQKTMTNFSSCAHVLVAIYHCVLFGCAQRISVCQIQCGGGRCRRLRLFLLVPDAGGGFRSLCLLALAGSLAVVLVSTLRLMNGGHQRQRRRSRCTDCATRSGGSVPGAAGDGNGDAIGCSGCQRGSRIGGRGVSSVGVVIRTGRALRERHREAGGGRWLTLGPVHSPPASKYRKTDDQLDEINGQAVMALLLL